MDSRIVHLALKVENLEETTAFYQKVFGFWEVETRKTRDHLSRHLTDGAMDFTLIKYDDGTQSAESKASGEGPCIHHFAIEVDDIEKYTEQIKQQGCQIDRCIVIGMRIFTGGRVRWVRRCKSSA